MRHCQPAPLACGLPPSEPGLEPCHSGAREHCQGHDSSLQLQQHTIGLKQHRKSHQGLSLEPGALPFPTADRPMFPAPLLQPAPGGKLVMFGGSVQGEFRELQPPNRIVMGWRFSSWEEGCMSQVRWQAGGWAGQGQPEA
jgi:hypothetical protein